tara:strand:- start:22432 stop:22647 length:216 start_codon:yes stop_codon:yes gene_type:complete
VTTLNQLREQRRLTWQAVARELSEIAASNGDDPIYYQRLWAMRTGNGRAVSQGERRALLEWSEDEVCSYIC